MASAPADPLGDAANKAMQDALHKAMADFTEKVKGVHETRVAHLSEENARLQVQVHGLRVENARLRAQLSRAKHLLQESDEDGRSAIAASSCRTDGAAEDSASTGTTLLARMTRPASLASLPEEPGKKDDADVALQDTAAEPHCSPVGPAAAAMCARRRREHGAGLHAHYSPTSAASMGGESMTMRDQPEEGGAGLCELLPLWQELTKRTPERRSQIQNKWKKPRRARTEKFRDLLTTSPASKQRIVWETLGVLFIIVDLVHIPLQAFHTHFDDLPLELNMLKAVYWTLDIPCSFFVGYFVNGVLEVRASKTSKRYLRTWFSVDITLAVLDWILICFHLLSNEGPRGGRTIVILRAGRTLRLLRFARLLRLLKLHRFFSKLLETIKSEYVLTLLHVGEILVVIVAVNHFIACFWYAIGTLDLDFEAEALGASKHWVAKFDESDGFAYRYTTAMHWSITQFTPASMEVVPRNAVERSYNIVVVIAGMVTFSTFVSSITQAMTHLRQIAGRRDAQFTQLRRYLGENNVSMQLATRVWRYYEQGSSARQQRLMWRDVVLFGDLPEILQMDLQHEVYMPTIARHPLFFQIQDQNAFAMRQICSTAIKEVSFRVEQDVFSDGLTVDKVYFLMEGALEYRVRCGANSPRMAETTTLESSSPEIVQEGQWLSEAAIWVKWFHMGKAVAKVHSVLSILSVPALHQVISLYGDLAPGCCAFARLFVKDLRAQGVSMSDLPLEVERLEDLARVAFGVENAGAEDRMYHHQIVRRKGVKATLKRGLSLISKHHAHHQHHEGRRTTMRVGGLHWFGGSEVSGAPPSRGSSLGCSDDLASVALEHAADCQGSTSSSSSTPHAACATPPHTSLVLGPGLVAAAPQVEEARA